MKIIFKYFRRTNGVWRMWQSHVYIFNWRAWISIIPFISIFVILGFPIGFLLDLANSLREIVSGWLDKLHPYIQRMNTWACDKREKEWESVREKLTRDSVVRISPESTEDNGNE